MKTRLINFCLYRHYEFHGDGPGELSIRKNELTCNRALGKCICVCVYIRVHVFSAANTGRRASLQFLLWKK